MHALSVGGVVVVELLEERCFVARRVVLNYFLRVESVNFVYVLAQLRARGSLNFLDLFESL
jgi:hypothetical protein